MLCLTLGTGLPEQQNLEKLFIQSMFVVSDDHGGSRIIKALQGHPTLEHLEFRFCFHEQINKRLESMGGLLSLQACKVCSLILVVVGGAYTGNLGLACD
jgi:hypothetical protein